MANLNLKTMGPNITIFFFNIDVNKERFLLRHCTQNAHILFNTKKDLFQATEHVGIHEIYGNTLYFLIK